MRWFVLLPGLVLGVVMALVTGMWQFALFTFVGLISATITTALVKRNKREPDMDFSDQPIWISPGAVAIGDKVLPKTGLFFKEQYSDIFFEHFAKIAKDREVENKRISLRSSFYKASKPGSVPFWAGISESVDLEFDLARDGPHVLIVGSTGSGKSEFLKLITSSMLVSSAVKSLQLVLIDFKGGAALRNFAEHPATLTLVTDLDEGRLERFWLYLAGELRRRERLLAEKRVSSIEQVEELPRLLVIADELPAIISAHHLSLGTLESIAARGRSLGVHLIATSQSLSGIPRALITNLTMRFAIGTTDPGDLIAMVPSLRIGGSNTSRAFAIWGSNTSSFDFPMTETVPDINVPKYWGELSDSWTHGLPLQVAYSPGRVGFLDIPSEHRIEELRFESFENSSLLLVGAQHSGKTWFSRNAVVSLPSAMVLDCPTIKELEDAFQTGKQIVCVLSSNFLLPLVLQRRFEHIIYLRQGNLDQHLAAGLPRSQWNEKLPPGRGWYRNLCLQLVMPEQTPQKSNQDHVLERQLR
jgi:tRNA A37 threonylcarbamoyladenosine biosynthesis protein TsaE